MADVFMSEPGSVLVVRTQAAAPLTLTLDGLAGPDGAYPLVRSTVLSLGLHQAGNHQFLHTLRDFVYVYVFGERIAEMTLGGVCFLRPCEGGPSGFQALYDFYLANRLAARAAPLWVAVGDSITLQAFLVDVRLSVLDAASALGQFALDFRYLPERSIG